MPGCWTGLVTSGKSSRGRVKGSSCPAAACSILSFTCPATPCNHVQAPLHPALSHGISLTHGKYMHTSHRQEITAHLSIALLEVSVDIDALQVLAAWQDSCLSSARLIKCFYSGAFATTGHRSCTCECLGNTWHFHHLIRPSRNMSLVFPLATKDGKECSMWTKMSM